VTTKEYNLIRAHLKLTFATSSMEFALLENVTVLLVVACLGK
jgi:hypothetical protein